MAQKVIEVWHSDSGSRKQFLFWVRLLLAGETDTQEKPKNTFEDTGDEKIEKRRGHASEFSGRCRVSFGWGTLLTNDFRDLTEGDRRAPFSLVCKAVSANGRPTVKLSDNPRKAMGPAEEIARYKRVFDVGAQAAQEVLV